MDDQYLLWLAQLAEGMRKQKAIDYKQLSHICDRLIGRGYYKDLLWFVNQLVVLGH